MDFDCLFMMKLIFLKKLFKWKVLKIFIEKCVSGFGLLFYKGMMIVLNL